MGFMVQVDENEDRKIIRYTRYALFMWCLFIGVGIGCFGEQWTSFSWHIAAPFLIVAGVVAVPSWRFTGEVKRAMREGSVKVSGSKWSFSNPLTIEIPKKRAGRPKAGDVPSEGEPSDGLAT